MNQTIVHARGYSAYDGRAGVFPRVMAFVFDLSVAVAALFLLLPLTGRLGLSYWPWLVASLPILIILQLTQRLAFGRTLGQHVWGLARRPAADTLTAGLWTRLRAPLRQRINPSGPLVFIATFLTLTAVSLSTLIATITASSHPLLRSDPPLALAPFDPAAAELDSSPGTDWTVLPFFYSIGAWPRAYAGKPILFELPYEKGPPQRFVGRITARWQMPDTRVTIEGPKTPVQASAARIRECFQPRAALFKLLDLGCLRLRERILGRHLREAMSARPSDWDVRWFRVENPALPEGEQPSGILITAAGLDQAQERFILVNGNGTQQALILDRPATDAGLAARKLLEQIVRTLRVSTELGTGRMWIDRRLTEVQLDNLEKQTDSNAFIARITDIQSTLLAKISVDPKMFDSYYHLGGTALLLLRHAVKTRNPDWSASARPMLQAAYAYAMDVSPSDTRTQRLQNLWLEAQKL